MIKIGGSANVVKNAVAAAIRNGSLAEKVLKDCLRSRKKRSTAPVTPFFAISEFRRIENLEFMPFPLRLICCGKLIIQINLLINPD